MSEQPQPGGYPGHQPPPSPGGQPGPYGPPPGGQGPPYPPPPGGQGPYPPPGGQGPYPPQPGPYPPAPAYLPAGHPATGYPGPYPGSAYAAPAGPGQPPPPPPAPLRSGPGQVSRVDIVPGTPFGVAYPVVAPTVAGLSVGSLVAGIGAVLAALLVICVGVTSGGNALLVSGAFAVLALFLAGAAIVTGVAGRRQVTRATGQHKGRGMATAGFVCGCAGGVLTLAGLAVATAISLHG